MASLFLSKDGYWQLRWRYRGAAKWESTGIQHDGKVDKNTGKPKPPKAAAIKKFELEQKLEKGQSPESRTVADLMDLVEKDYKTRELKSIGSLHSRLAHIRKFFGTAKAASLTTDDLRDYTIWRREGNGAVMVHKNRYNDTEIVRAPVAASNKTIKNEIQLIGKALREVGIVVPKLPKLELPRPRQGFFNDEMIGAVVGHLPVYLQAPVLVAYATGWREGEICSMKLADVDLKAGEMRVWDSKTKHWKVFPIDVVPTLRALLDGLLHPAPKEASTSVVVDLPVYLFVRTMKDTGRLRAVREIRKAWDTACVKAGFPGMLFHDLRRSAARNLNNAGWPRQMIKSWCGWKTDAMFERYCIQSPTDIQIVRDRMARVAEMDAHKRGQA